MIMKQKMSMIYRQMCIQIHDESDAIYIDIIAIQNIILCFSSDFGRLLYLNTNAYLQIFAKDDQIL